MPAQNVGPWFLVNQLTHNGSKIYHIIFLPDKRIQKLNPVKLLGITLDTVLVCNPHIDIMCSRFPFNLRRYLVEKVSFQIKDIPHKKAGVRIFPNVQGTVWQKIFENFSFVKPSFRFKVSLTDYITHKRLHEYDTRSADNLIALKKTRKPT